MRNTPTPGSRFTTSNLPSHLVINLDRPERHDLASGANACEPLSAGQVAGTATVVAGSGADGESARVCVDQPATATLADADFGPGNSGQRMSAVLPFVEVNESGGDGGRGDDDEEEDGEGEWEDVVEFCYDEVMEFS